MEKAIEIKRRAQRSIQSGDLAGALSAYQKLAQSEDADPYNYVLIADLQFKMGDTSESSQSYLAAVQAYEAAKLYKNAIAICKKMIRLSLSPPVVLQRLGQLHALDGLGTEAALYYMQYAEHQVREEKYTGAVETLQKAVEACPESVRTLEKLAEVQLLAANESAAIASLILASRRWRAAGSDVDLARTRARAEQVRPGSTEVLDRPDAEAEPEPEPESAAAADDSLPSGPPVALPIDGPITAGAVDRAVTARPALEQASEADAEPQGFVARPAPAFAADDQPEGFESGRASWTSNEPEEAWQPSEAQIAGPAPAAAKPVAVPATPARTAEIEAMLREAEQQLKAGDRDAAAAALMRAAQGYEDIGRAENAASIYRSLARSAHVPADVLPQWLDNCERRGDKVEASQVACQRGDRALNEGDTATALTWFTRAHDFDPANDLAVRRLRRLEEAPDGVAPAATPAAPAVPAPPADSGKVSVALGKAQAVTFDLGAMLDEFQRAVGEQLSGDVQSHYDLGVTYREMGLHEQAIASFRTAAQDPAYAARCTEMIGRCLLDQGQIDAAIAEFANALQQGVAADAAPSLRYQLALAYEAAGRTQEALAEFERVAADQANYPDVAQKIRALRRALESV